MEKLSEVEKIKQASNYLRGTITKSIEDQTTGAFLPDDTQLIKFHGFYQQTDRDLDSERKHQKLEPLYSCMLRIRVPGGVMNSAQWLVLDQLSHTYGNDTMKITTRQAIQLHGVYKTDLQQVISSFYAVGMDSIAGCGDVNRNVMCHSLPNINNIHGEVYEAAKLVSAYFTPKTTAWHEIWIDGKQISEDDQQTITDEEPIYGKTYLPRKFKIAFAIPPSNDTDIYANDIGIIAIIENNALIGYNITVGGGLGMTFGMPDTYPRLGDLFGFIPKDQLIPICEAILTTQRDWGNRENRKFSRLKYTIDRVGIKTFMSEVERRADTVFLPAKPFLFTRTGDEYGWSNNTDGTANVLLFIEGGRIADGIGKYHLMIKTAMREIATIHQGTISLTGNQNLVIGNISPDTKDDINRILLKYGLMGNNTLSGMRRNSIACVALNTCTLAFAEAERYLPFLIDRIELMLYEFNLHQEEISIRMTGCPNGCGRPYLGEIGLVGRSLGKYNLYIGAAFNGERLNKLYKEMCDEEEILQALRPLLLAYSNERNNNESFGDFVVRMNFV